MWKHYFEVIEKQDELRNYTPDDMAEQSLRMCDICDERLWEYCVQPNSSETGPDEAFHILESIGGDTAPYALVCEECFNKKFNQYDWIYKCFIISNMPNFPRFDSKISAELTSNGSEYTIY